jgi:RNA recognition motif-containing protein
MRPNDSRGSGRRSGRGPRRSSRSRNDAARPTQTAPAKKTFWQKLVSFFRPAPASSSNGARSNATPAPSRESRSARKPEAVEVTSPKLYIGNLSYDATESDLFELFKGVGTVKNAEIVAHKYNEKSKGFGFVTMSSVDEAKRAVVELHDKEFMGRKLVVSGAKTTEREPNYRG